MTNKSYLPKEQAIANEHLCAFLDEHDIHGRAPMMVIADPEWDCDNPGECFTVDFGVVIGGGLNGCPYVAHWHPTTDAYITMIFSPNS